MVLTVMKKYEGEVRGGGGGPTSTKCISVGSNELTRGMTINYDQPGEDRTQEEGMNDYLTV
jgi:hypothetical protein